MILYSCIISYIKLFYHYVHISLVIIAHFAWEKLFLRTIQNIRPKRKVKLRSCKYEVLKSPLSGETIYEKKYFTLICVKLSEGGSKVFGHVHKRVFLRFLRNEFIL